MDNNKDTKELVKKSDPLQPVDFFSQFSTVPNTFGKVKTKESTRQLPSFNPNDFSYLTNPTPYDNSETLQSLNAARQPYSTQIGHSIAQFGANVVSSFGQGLANTFDLMSTAKTVKGQITGSDDDFSSTLMGISTKDMADWAKGIAARNQVLEENPGEFNPGSMSWWLTQYASAGTGLGMGLEALATTVGIEAATGGAGTGAALLKLGNMFKRGAKIGEAVNIAKGLKSAATLYGVVNRYSEARMEGQNTSDEIYNELSAHKNEDGTPKYTETQLRHFASEGARRDFNWNLALLPLDILAFRTMVYNPISGSGTGLIEGALGKIANKGLRKATQFGVGAFFEGTEEGFQFIGQEEGMHYANVLAGLDDGDGFLERVGAGIATSEFWNNFAGGVIGSPIISGAMNLANRIMTGNRAAKTEAFHKNFVANIGKMDDAMSENIKSLEAKGHTKTASVQRRQISASKALSAIHLDAMTDKDDTAFDSHIMFINGVLAELNNNKTDALTDLGFNNPTPDQLAKVKEEFTNYAKDATEMKKIYDDVKNNYNKNFVPAITQQHFQLNRLLESMPEVDAKVGLLVNNLHQHDQLSSHGKEIHNTEYKLAALMAEKERLANSYRKTTGEQERKNIQDLIDLNKTRIAEVADNLKTISTSESYTEHEKDKDNDILRSALRSKEYQQAIYDKEYIANEIALSRKNIGLWSDPKYIASKNELSVKKAKTRTQVEATEEAIVKAKEEAVPKVKASIQDKKNEIAANEAAETIQRNHENLQEAAAHKETNDPNNLRNYNLFGDEHNLINQVKGAVTLTTDPETTGAAPDESYMLSPAQYDFNKSSDEAKENVVSGVGGLITKLKADPTFEDLVRHVIKVQGIATADEIFNALKYGWEKNNMPVEDYQAVYDKIFGDPLGKVLAGTRGLVVQSGEQYEKEVKESTEKVIAKEDKPDGFDSNNQGIYSYKGRVTNESSPKLSFSTRLSEMTQTKEDDGTVAVSYEYTEQELNRGDYVDSLQLLDPDFDKELVIRIPGNFMELDVPMYDDTKPNGKGKAISFGQWVAQTKINGRPVTPEDQEYQDKIPMIHYIKGAPTTQKGVSFVHDVGWYHPLRFNQNKREDMDLAIANTREIRRAVIANPKNSEDVVITKIRQTTFAGLKTKLISPGKYEQIPLKEAAPHTQFVISKGVDPQALEASYNIPFVNNKRVLLNSTPVKKGKIYDVRRYGKIDGVDTYQAFPVFRDKIDEISRSSVLQAINIYANRTNPNPEVRALHAPIIKHIKDTMGIDILSSSKDGGLENYLSHFIKIQKVRGANTNEEAHAIATAKESAGTPYIGFIGGGNIVFGRAGETMYVDSKTQKKVNTYYINPNLPTPSTLSLKALSNPKTNFLGWYEQNVDQDSYDRNKPVVTIDQNLKTDVTANSYNDFLLERLKTDIKSVNIGTKEKPNWITNVQPVITYDLKSKFKQGLPTNEEIKEKIITEEAEQVKEEVKEAIKSEPSKQDNELSDIEKEIERAIIEQANKDLGQDIGKGKEGGILLSPASSLGFNTDYDYLEQQFIDKARAFLISRFLKKEQNLEEIPINEREKSVEEWNKKYNYWMGSIKAFLEYNHPEDWTEKGYEMLYDLPKDEIFVLMRRIHDLDKSTTIEFASLADVYDPQSKHNLKFNEHLTKEAESVRSFLEDNLGIVNRQYDSKQLNLLSPARLTTGQREEVSSSINRIAGLTPDQQADITDFMYNQVTTIVNLDNKLVTRAEVDRHVDNTFQDVIVPLRKEYKEKIDQYTKLLDQHPNLRKGKIPDLIEDYKYRIAKVDAIENNFEVLKTEAYNRVAKYTGITQNKVLTEKFNDDNDLIPNDDTPDDDPDNYRDFMIDVFEESPESRLTYAMRRFFGQIREYDKKGELMTGFLGLPTYTGADTVIRTLMVTLADVKSDFQAMIDKLESRKAGIPWMQEVINKLNGASQQKKNQFVTVMSNTSVRPKFMMIKYDQRTDSWTTKMYDTSLSGIADAVKSKWKANTLETGLVIPGDEGHYILNTERAKHVLHQFESWKGQHIPSLETDMTPWRPTVDKVKVNSSITIIPTGGLLAELNAKVTKLGDRMKFGMKGNEFQITKLKDNKYEIAYLKQGLAINTLEGKTEAMDWLANFGIELTDNTVHDLMANGMLHNYKIRKPSELFTTNDGLFQILYNILKRRSEGHDFTEKDDSLLDETVINSLATLEAQYNDTSTPFGYRDGKKSLFALSLPKYITDRARDLKDKDSNVLKQLESISFSSGSLWLRLLSNDKFRTLFNVSHLGLTAFKQQGKKNYRDNGINKLADLDHELTKLGMFWDDQGEVNYSYLNAEGKEVNSKTYPGTNISLRMGTMFSPTMSDKKIMTLITTAVLNLQNKDLLEGNGISDEVTKVLYEQTIRPELLRMIKFHQNGSETDIVNDPTKGFGYDKGAAMFLLFPEMNNIEYSPGLKLIDAIKHRPDSFTAQHIEGNADLMKAFSDSIRAYVNKLTEDKVKAWKKNGLISMVSNESKIMEEMRGIMGIDPNARMEDKRAIGTIDKMEYADKKYSAKFAGDATQKVNMMATDFVVNSLIANANSFMVFAGDPAMYFKSKSDSYVEQSKDTFINAGKRLANQVAPGTTLANSENEKYLQVFLNDRQSIANNLAHLEEILGKEGAAPYANIKEGSDAQEYTTWKEHLDILARLGKTPDNLSDISPEDIQEARDIFASGISKSKLSNKQMQLIGKVMQPLKPVYSGQIYDPAQDLMRTVYIKSSSFPLIPQLTEDMEIDKLRIALEKAQDKYKMNVRASYQSANKVGASSNPVEIWKEDGRVDDKALENITHWKPFDKDEKVDFSSDVRGVNETPFLVLDRKNFRIQQEVPFKSGKSGDDTISLGTQLMKLIFGDEIMTYDGFDYNGKPHTGRQLHTIYNETFNKLVLEKQDQLFNELGLDKAGNPIDLAKSMAKIQSVLKDEAIKRGYPLQDIEGLTIDLKTGQFNLPLWASSNSNRYESMLNSIITNRLIKMKFPGNSYVVGSEEGFKIQENLASVDKSRIIFTSSYNGSELYAGDNKGRPAQVFAASKFKDHDGNLVNLFEGTGNDRKYVTKTDKGWMLKEDMIDKSLLSLTTFRIPTSGLSSASQVEIVGFLPFESADLMIVPKNFTKQKGLDFDIDKENGYQFWHYMTKDGKFKVMDETDRDKILADADVQLRQANIQKLRAEYKEAETEATKKHVLVKINAAIAENKLINSMFVDVKYTEEDLEGNKFLTKLNSKITEKLLQNEIVKIKKSVLSNPNLEIQAKITRVLNTDYSERQAKFIEELNETKRKEELAKQQDTTVDKIVDYWTPLSDEFQKEKMFLGASGKVGTAAYATDITFHSLAQQAAIDGKPIRLIEMVEDEDGKAKPVPKVWRFGNYTSDSELGGRKTVDGSRTVSDRLNEAGQIAVDNEKLQVMGAVGLNDITLDVDKVFNLTRLDKGKDGNSISYLFLSQPIIKEFVEKKRNANSNMADFSLDKEKEIFDELIAKYDPSTDTTEENYEELMSDEMNNDSLAQQIRAEVPNGKLQGAILRRFMEMKDYGKAIRKIQSSINTDSRGLGKSFFDVIEKRDALNMLGRGTDKILGASGLVGEYVLKETGLTEEKQKTLIEQGHVDIGEFLVKPNTFSGSFNINGVATAYNLWSRFFPYDSAVAQRAFTEILSIIGSESMGDTRKIEYKQHIFQGIKKYFSANKLNGIIGSNDSTNNERARLYIDSEEVVEEVTKTGINEDGSTFLYQVKTGKIIPANMSLARYVKNLLQTEGNDIINTYIKKNKLINRFDFDIQKNGQPSLIKFNSATGEEFDEQYLYESLSTLIEDRGKDAMLPDFNGKEYSIDMLAQDLIAYSYLGNAVQEAIQFTKYTPVSFLNAVGYSEKMRLTNLQFQTSPKVLEISQGDPTTEAHLVSGYTMQYIQHNPEKVKEKYHVKEIKKYVNINPDGTFTFKDKRKPTFVTVYDPGMPKGDKKFRLYWFDGEKYTKIDVLGMFGMDEYQPENKIGKSIVNGRVRLKINPQPIIAEEGHANNQTSLFNIESGTPYEIISAIATSNTTKYSQLAAHLLPFIGDVTIKLQEIPSFGRYTPNIHEILVSPVVKNNPGWLAYTILHELVHGLTVRQIIPHLTGFIDPEVKEGAPSHVIELVRIFNNAKSKFSKVEIDTIRERVASGGSLEDADRKLYGFTDIREFIAEALTNKEFQKLLNSIPYAQSGKSMLDKFKEIVEQVLTALGVKFDKDFSAAHAISNIFEAIEAENKRDDTGFDPYQMFTDESNDDVTDPGTSLSPAKIIIQEARKGNLIGVYNDLVRANPNLANEVLLDYARQKYGVDQNGELNKGGGREIANKIVDKLITEQFPNQETLIDAINATERDYINNNTDANTDNTINDFLSLPATDEGAYAKFIGFKREQIAEAHSRLNEIEKAKRKAGVSPDERAKLNTQERDTRLYIEGNREFGIKGLRQEIAELEKNPSIDAVSYYVEKDLNRLNKLANSNNIDDIREAEHIIDFYTLAGTFEKGTENPFFTKEEMFLTDENDKETDEYRLSDSTMQKFKDWKDEATKLKNRVITRKEEATVNQVQTSSAVIKTYGEDKTFVFSELMNKKGGLKDVDWLSMWSMDVTAGIFSSNGLIPQVMFSTLSDRFEQKLIHARRVEEAVDKISPKVSKELMAMGESLRGIGILGIKGASFQIFKEVTREGNETGGYIQRFVREFFDAQSSMLNRFQKKHDEAGLIVDYEAKNKAFNTAFEDRKKWRRNHTIIVDIDNIPELLATTTPEAEAHKKSLVDILGQKGYDEQVAKQKKLLDKYEVDKQSNIIYLTTLEGVADYDSLSPKAKSDIASWESAHSPKRGVEDYNSVKGIFFGNRKTNSYMSYNVFVPRKFKPTIAIAGEKYSFTDTTDLTGHYNTKFETIENNPVLSEFYDLLRSTCELIRENMPYELQKKMAVNTIPALIKTSAEIIADKNTGKLSSLFLAFRNLVERVRLEFGVIRQSDQSHATLDPVTGKANYKVNDTFLQGNVRAVEQRMTIEETKFIQAYNSSVPNDERLSKIGRFSIVSLNKLDENALILLAEYINVDISLADIQAGNIQAIRDRTGDTVAIGKFIKDYSLHQVVQSQSFDLPKIMKYYSNLAMEYSARQEALPILEIMKQHYEEILKPNTNNLSKGLYNAKGEKFEMGGLRTRAMSQMDDWFERVVLNNYGIKHVGELGKPIYSREEKKKIKEIDELLKTETDEARIAELTEIRKNLGRVKTATAFFDNIFNWIRTLRLGYNVSSATTNFLEGVTSNMILAADGGHFDSKEIYYAYNIVKSMALKNVSFGKLETGLARRNRKLMDKFDVIMDSKNELQKSSVKSYASKFSWLNPHELNQRVEFVNQSPIMIAMLRTEKIKDKNGKESSVWNAMDNNGHLKDDFKTEENTENWENLSGSQYLVFKQKLHKVIGLGHGLGYDKLRGMMIKSGTIGKAVAMFKTWLPTQLYWRLAVEQDDIQLGKKGFKGRYWSYGKGSGLIHGAIVGTTMFGPVGGAIMGAAGLFLGAKFGTDTGVGMLREMIETTKQLAKKALGMPVNLLSGRKIISEDTKAFDKWIGKGKNGKTFTEQDARNMRGNMADISLQLAWLAMIILTKSLLWDDDDEPDDAERIWHNILVNKLMNLSSQATLYVNPVDAYETTVGSNAIVQYLTDLGKEVHSLNEWVEGRDIIQSGINAGESGLSNQTYKTFMPGIFKDNLLGFKSQSERVFEESFVHPWFKSGAKLDQESNKRERASRRLGLEDELDLDRFEGDNKIEKAKNKEKFIRQTLNEESPTPARLKKLGMTRDEYEEAREAQE